MVDKRKRTTRDRVDSWSRTVKWVEDHPTDFLHHEYENALNGRNWIGIALTEEEIEPTIRADMARLDERFRRATRETPRVFRALVGDEQPGWWWYRIPLKVGPEFIRLMEFEVPGLARELGLEVPPTDS